MTVILHNEIKSKIYMGVEILELVFIYFYLKRTLNSPSKKQMNALRVHLIGKNSTNIIEVVWVEFEIK